MIVAAQNFVALEQFEAAKHQLGEIHHPFTIALLVVFDVQLDLSLGAIVVCFDLGPGDALAFEGSANLRTNRSREQLTAIRDRATHDWHAGWIDEMVRADDGQET